MYFQSLRYDFMRRALFTFSESSYKGNVCSPVRVGSPSRGVYFINKMPKKEKTQTKNIQVKKQSEPPTSPVSMLKDGSIAISIHAKPGAKHNAVTDVSSEAVGVAVAAPPTDGEANAELMRYLSRVLQLKKSEVLLEKGSKSREKVIKVTASISQEVVLERLMREAAG